MKIENLLYSSVKIDENQKQITNAGEDEVIVAADRLCTDELLNLAKVTKPSDKIISCAEIMLVIFGHGHYEKNPVKTWQTFTSKIVNSGYLKVTQGLVEVPDQDIRLVAKLLESKDMTISNL